MRLIYLAPSHPLADHPRSPQIACKGREGAEYGVVDTVKPVWPVLRSPKARAL